MGRTKFARENRQLIMGDHQNIDKLLEESDPVTTRLSTVEGHHQNIDKFLRKVNKNTLAIAENQSSLAKIREALRVLNDTVRKLSVDVGKFEKLRVLNRAASKLGIDLGAEQNRPRIGGVSSKDEIVKAADDTNYAETDEWII